MAAARSTIDQRRFGRADASTARRGLADARASWNGVGLEVMTLTAPAESGVGVFQQLLDLIEVHVDRAFGEREHLRGAERSVAEFADKLRAVGPAAVMMMPPS